MKINPLVSRILLLSLAATPLLMLPGCGTGETVFGAPKKGGPKVASGDWYTITIVHQSDLTQGQLIIEANSDAGVFAYSGDPDKVVSGTKNHAEIDIQCTDKYNPVINVQGLLPVQTGDTAVVTPLPDISGPHQNSTVAESPVVIFDYKNKSVSIDPHHATIMIYTRGRSFQPAISVQPSQ